ncbi:MAG TPA: alkaline phosphatase family protein, partial [Vicinamibacterales bacterium]|nr:alkaline phosphatase family protein [Vicinamibacterales bacterium]
MIRALSAAAALPLVIFSAAASPRIAAQAPERPRLLVVVVVDQMRNDYLDRMAPLWTRGMKRLLTEGAVFERNFYPYLQTVTCAGHATIGTGSFPATHGIIMNSWWRGTRNGTCT